MKTTLVFTATVVATFASFAEVISEKSPDGRNEIRLTTEPVLSYSILRDGKERVAPTPISLTVEGKGVLGGKVKVAETARVPRAGTIATPIYKKATVTDNGNETKVSFVGGWQVFLHARNDGVAYRFATTWADPLVKVTAEAADVAFPCGDLTVYAGLTRTRSPSPRAWRPDFPGAAREAP